MNRRQGRTKSLDAPSGAPLKDALAEFLRSSGLAGMLKNPQLHGAWQRTVGEDIAQHTRVVRLNRGILDVSVDSSALMNDIQFHKASLLKDLRREVAKPFIQDIVFTHRSLQEEHDGHE